MRSFFTSYVVFAEFFWKPTLSLAALVSSVVLMTEVGEALAYLFGVYIFLVSLFASGVWLAEAIQDYRSYLMTHRMQIAFDLYMDKERHTQP